MVCLRAGSLSDGEARRKDFLCSLGDDESGGVLVAESPVNGLCLA